MGIGVIGRIGDEQSVESLIDGALSLCGRIDSQEISANGRIGDLDTSVAVLIVDYLSREGRIDSSESSASGRIGSDTLSVIGEL